jgi:dephospho-CoA kinase
MTADKTSRVASHSEGVSAKGAKGGLPPSNKTLVIGITGGMASGKSTVANMFEGISHVDADALVHQLMRDNKETITALATAFPIAVTHGNVDRAVLAGLISKDPNALATLEKILHPRVRALEQAAIHNAHAQGKKAIILDIPLLFETDADAMCDVVIVVHAPPELRRERALTRKGMTEEKWHRLLNRQLPDHERLARAHHVIHTSTSMEETRKQVAALMKQLGLI